MQRQEKHEILAGANWQLLKEATGAAITSFVLSTSLGKNMVLSLKMWYDLYCFKDEEIRYIPEDLIGKNLPRIQQT